MIHLFYDTKVHYSVFLFMWGMKQNAQKTTLFSHLNLLNGECIDFKFIFVNKYTAMNRPHIFITLSLAVLAVSCTALNEAEDCFTELGLIQEPVTRTHLHEQDGSFPIYWTDGDRIVANGVTSAPLTLEGGKALAEAVFKVSNIEPPFRVIYPHTAYAGADGDNYSVSIPARQVWKEGSFAEGAALMWGESADADSKILMHHLTGVVRLSLTSLSAYVVQSLTVKSLDDIPLSGTFTLSDGKLTAVDGDGIQVILPEGGIPLGNEPVDFYIAIPSGEYPSGLEFTLTGANRRVLHCNWLRESEGAEPGISVKAGSIVIFSPLEFHPDAFEIYSASDWEEFAAACNNGSWEENWLSKDGSVHIGADFSAESLTPLNSFSGILDGKGHTITQTAAALPLVKTLSGTVRNLTLAGVNHPSDPGVTGASVFTGTIAGGIIENCVNQTVLTVEKTASTVVSGVFCRSFNGGSIIDCRNEADVKVIADISSKDFPVAVGGFVGIVRDLSSVALVKDCVNSGNVTVLLVKPAAATTRPVNAAYAGIVANVISGNIDNYLRIEGCTNSGNISVSFDTDPTKANALLSGSGGILGMSTALSATGAGFSSTAANQGSFYLEIDHCTNTGTINSNLVQSGSTADVYKIFSGGIAGVISGYQSLFCPVTSCANYGKVIPYEGKAYNRAAYCTAAGGLAGYATYVSFTDCTVKSAQVGTLNRQAFAVSGCIALAHRAIRMSGCKIFANLQLIRVKDYTERSYSLGFTLPTNNAQGNISASYINMEGSVIENSLFGGSVTYNVTPVTGAATGGFGAIETQDFTASNFASNICSPSYGGSQVSLTGNSWWNGE